MGVVGRGVGMLEGIAVVVIAVGIAVGWMGAIVGLAEGCDDNNRTRRMNIKA